MTLRRRVSPAERQASLRRLLARPGLVRLMEAHNGLSAIVAEDAKAVVSGAPVEFDGLWAGSFADSASKGQPDASIVGPEGRLQTIQEILRVTHKPLLVDGDTGGDGAQFVALVRNLEDLGVSGVVIEDKLSPKRNSLARDAVHLLDDAPRFAWKIELGKRAALSEDFLIFARIESLIAGASVDDALERARAYIAAGADGILIHSKQEQPEDLFKFAATFHAHSTTRPTPPPLLCVPTSYNQFADQELFARGFKVVIHANQLVRAAYSAMTDAARRVLESDRSLEADNGYASVEELSSRVGLDQVIERDKSFELQMRGESVD